jgi:hypothetical protein
MQQTSVGIFRLTMMEIEKQTINAINDTLSGTRTFKIVFAHE